MARELLHMIRTCIFFRLAGGNIDILGSLSVSLSIIKILSYKYIAYIIQNQGSEKWGDVLKI